MADTSNELYTRDDAAVDGETNVVVDDLASRDGEITMEDLRTIPGAADLTDDELKQLWTEAQGADAAKPADSAAAAAVQRAWKYYGADDKEISDVDKLTVADFLRGKLSYTANEKEQRKTLDELIRVAQFGHLNDSKLRTAVDERNSVYEKYQKLVPEHARLTQQQQLLGHALDEFTRGNEAPLKALVDAYRTARGTPPAVQSAPAAAADQPDAAAMRVYYETVVPAANELAKRFNVDPQSVSNLILQMVDEEPAEFFTAAKLQQILQHDAAARIEQLIGASGAPAAAGTDEVARLRAENAALKANATNAMLDGIRARNRRTPPAAGSGATVGGGSNDAGSIPKGATESASAFRDFLKS